MSETGVDVMSETKFHLKFADEAEMLTILSAFRVPIPAVYDDLGNEVEPASFGELIAVNHDYEMLVNISIRSETGVTLTDESGNEYPETVPVAGYHVNFALKNETRRADLEAIPSEYLTYPATPAVVWA